MIVDTKIASTAAKRPPAGKVTLFVNETNELKIKLADNTVTSPFSDVIVSVTTVYNGLPAAANPATATTIVYHNLPSLSRTVGVVPTNGVAAASVPYWTWDDAKITITGAASSTEASTFNIYAKR